jgi:hypothetical protein
VGDGIVRDARVHRCTSCLLVSRYRPEELATGVWVIRDSTDETLAVDGRGELQRYASEEAAQAWIQRERDADAAHRARQAEGMAR